MFAKNKVSQSLVDAVSSIVNEAEKVPTTTGMKVYGSSYGNSQKARKDQLKSTLADVKGPSKSDIEKEKEVKEELKGNQHKIDKNKNNKIDAEDFKMLRKEELKGDQHKIDANKNNKIDAHDFQLLRGRKKVKEDTFAAKLLNSLSEKKGTDSSDPLANRQDYAKRHGTGQVYKKTHAGDKTGMTQAFAYDIKRSGPKGKLPEEVEQVDEASTYKLGRADAETKEFPIKQNGEHVGRLEFHVSAGKLHHRAGNAKDVSYDKWHGNPNTESLVNAHVAKHEAEARKHFAKKLKEEVELNEVSKSEVDHHYDKWTTSEYAPDHHDAGDDNKIHKSALKYLRNTNEPKENHEKIAKHIANKFHGSGIDESAPKKMDDVAKQNLTPAKKGVVGTVKSDFKNFKSFLAGKKETNEEVESLDEDRYLMKYLLSRGINPKYVDRNTRVGHAKSNEFKKWKADHLNSLIVTRESNEMPFDGPYTKTKKDVKDKSGAIHTPMSRARNLARAALKSVQDKTKIK